MSRIENINEINRNKKKDTEEKKTQKNVHLVC